MIATFDGGAAAEILVERPMARWAPEKYAVCVVVDDQPRGFIWHTDEVIPADTGYYSGAGIRFELYELIAEAKQGDVSNPVYRFKEKI